MIDVPFFSGLDPILLFVKVILLAFLLLIIIVSFIFFNEVRSLNKVVTFLASFSATTLQLFAFLYFLAFVSLFFFVLVIL